MKLVLPNSAALQNIQGYIRRYTPDDPSTLDVQFDQRWIHLDPFALTLAACLGAEATRNGVQPTGVVPQLGSLRYTARMHLFDFLRLHHSIDLTEHEQSGRFIPLTQIHNTSELQAFITDLIPLLHAGQDVVDPIKYVVSELVRNVIEHAESPIGAIVCAQYYATSQRVSIAVGDSGRGMLTSMRRSHAVESYSAAISLALRPGITGVTKRVGGNEFNAGAGLFFTKSLASLSRRSFAIYSGNALYKLLPLRHPKHVLLHPSPLEDHHRFESDLPRWQGTLVGMELNIRPSRSLADLLQLVRAAYHIGASGKRKDYAKQVRFS